VKDFFRTVVALKYDADFYRKEIITFLTTATQELSKPKDETQLNDFTRQKLEEWVAGLNDALFQLEQTRRIALNIEKGCMFNQLPFLKSQDRYFVFRDGTLSEISKAEAAQREEFREEQESRTYGMSDLSADEYGRFYENDAPNSGRDEFLYDECDN